MDEIGELVRDLTDALMHEIIRLEWQPPAFITREVTAVTRAVLEEHGFAVRAELGFGCDRRPGFLDLAAYRGDQLRIAVEIDRSDKPRSIAKLQEAARRGLVPLWVRWGHDLPGETGKALPAELCVVEIPIDFRRGRLPRPLWRVRPIGWVPRE